MAFDYEEILAKPSAITQPPSLSSREAAKLFSESGFKDILDLGCGNGRDCKSFKDYGLNITGADISAKSVERARQLNPEVKFLVSNALELPFSDSSFDGVYSFGLLHVFTENIQEARFALIKEIKRILKPSGLAYMTTLWTDIPGCGLPELACLTEQEVDKLSKELLILSKEIVRDKSCTGWDSIYWRLIFKGK